MTSRFWNVTTAALLPLICFAASVDWDFSPGGNGGAWKVSQAIDRVQTPEGLYLHGPVATNMEIVFEEGLDASAYPFLEYRFSSGEYSSGWLYFAREGEDYDKNRRVRLRVPGFDMLGTQRVKMTENKLWKGTIRKIRINPIPRELDNVHIRSLAFTDSFGGEVLNGSFESIEGGKADKVRHWSLAGDAATVAGGAYAGERFLRLRGGNASAEFELKKEKYPFEMTAAHRHSRGGKVTLVYRDICDKEIGKEEIVLPSSDEFRIFKKRFTQPEGAAFVTATFDGSVDLDAVAVRQIKPASEKYRWHDAHWIWDRPNFKSAGKPIRFRRKFTVHDPSPIRRMVLQVTTRNVGGVVPCDTVGVWLNGKKIAPAFPSSSGSWVELYDVKPYLRKGVNVIAIEVINGMYDGGLLAEFLLENSGSGPGRFTRFGTNPSWRTTDALEEKWTSPDFDDRHWRAAGLRGQPSPGSFCRIPYRFLGTCGTIRFVDPEFPTALSGERPGRIKCGLQIAAEPGCGDITDASALFFHLIDFQRRSVAKFKACRFTRQQLAEGKVTLDFPVETRFLREGEYELRIYADRLRISEAPAGFRLDPTGNFIARKVTVSHGRKPGLPAVRIDRHHTVPRFIVDGKAFPVQRFTHGVHTQLGTEENLRIGGLMVSPDQPVMDMWINVWTYDADGKCDFSACDSFMMSHLSRHPDTRFIIHWPLDTAGTRGGMRKWILAHPEVWAKNSKMSVQSGTYLSTNVVASMAAEAWRNAAADATAKFVRHIAGSPYADRVIGIMPCCGISSEWLYWGSQARDFMDYSDPFQNGFRKFLKEKYGTLDKLNAAWAKQFKDWQAVGVPSEEERRKVSHDDFLLFPANGAVRDLREFLNLTVSDSIIRMVKAVKAASGNRLLAGVYYGYSTYFSGPYMAPFSGHHALGRVLRCPELDFLFSPCRYDDRGTGGASGFMAPVASVRAHGKLWCNEADNRLLHSWDRSGRSDTLRGSAAVIVREFASTFATASGQGWLDFGEGWLPYDSRLRRVFKDCLRVSRQLAEENAIAPDPENAIAVVLDEQAIFRAPYKQRLFLNLVGIYPHLLRTGTGVHWYLLSDLEKLEQYKCIVFTPTVNALTAEQRRFIDGKLKKNGRTLVFLYSTGIYDGDKFLPGEAGREAGVKVDFRQSGSKYALRRNPGADPVLKYLPDYYTFGFAEPADFKMMPQKDAQTEVLFSYDREGKSPGMVRRRHSDWTAVYSASNGLSAPVLRGLAEEAGIRIFNPFPGDVTYTAKGFCSVHTLRGGKRTFRLPERARKVVDPLSGREYKIENGTISVELPPESTAMFRICE